MPDPKLAPRDTDPAEDLRVVVPSNAVLNPLPRAVYVAGDGDLVMDAPGTLSALPVTVGAIIPVRPLRILPATTATVVALY